MLNLERVGGRCRRNGSVAGRENWLFRSPRERRSEREVVEKLVYWLAVLTVPISYWQCTATGYRDNGNTSARQKHLQCATHTTFSYSRPEFLQTPHTPLKIEYLPIFSIEILAIEFLGKIFLADSCGCNRCAKF